MDERLAKALEFSNHSITLRNQQRILQEQYQNDLVHYCGGGQFTVTKELISFVSSLVVLQQEEFVLIDDSGLPINVESIAEFANAVLDIYVTASNKYLYEYNKLKKNRTVEGLIKHD